MFPVEDDHLPFVAKGIPSVDIIDLTPFSEAITTPPRIRLISVALKVWQSWAAWCWRPSRNLSGQVSSFPRSHGPEARCLPTFFHGSTNDSTEPAISHLSSFLILPPSDWGFRPVQPERRPS